MAEGKILSSGRVSAKSVALALGLGGPESLKKEDRTRVPLSPSQAREAMSGREPKKHTSDADVRVTVVEGGRDAAAFFGVSTGTAFGEGKEGMPLDPEETPRDKEPQPERTDWQRIDEQREGRRIAREIEKAEQKMRALLKKEAAVEVARRRRAAS